MGPPGSRPAPDESMFKCYMADTGLLVSKLFADGDLVRLPLYMAHLI